MSRTEIEIPLAPPYRVVIGAGVLRELAEHAPGLPLVALDLPVFELHGSRLPPILASVVLPSGEEAKSWDALEHLLSTMAHVGLDRNSTLAVLGGGSALDVGGLAAALYMRGIRVVYCPTTLLAMVDASVGGKTAINIDEGKNLVGAIHQPSAVLADTDTLATLPEVEWRSGLGEVVKTALVAGEELLGYVERHAEALAAREPAAVERVIGECVRTKARVVVSDVREAGPRKQLNLGHTFAHAIERVAGYGAIPHGVAVAAGLTLAVRASELTGHLADPQLPQRLAALLRALGLPHALGKLRMEHALESQVLLRAMRLDKKARDGQLHFVLPRRAGDLELDAHLPDALLLRLLS